MLWTGSIFVPVHNSILVTDYLTKMNIETVPQPPYSPDLAPCDFCLFPKLRGYSYETIEEMKEAVMKVIDMLTQEDFHGAFQKLLEQYKCIAAGGDYLEGDSSFMCVLSIKVPIRKSLEIYLMILVSDVVYWEDIYSMCYELVPYLCYVICLTLKKYFLNICSDINSSLSSYGVNSRVSWAL